MEQTMKTIISKYFKPTSLTWWSGVGLIILGGVESYQTKSISPKIPAGLGMIGIRGAIPTAP
jgi:hypothetical protein